MTTTVITESKIITAGEIAVMTLIILLALRVIFEVNAREGSVSHQLVKTSGIASIALLFAFVMIVLFKIAGFL